MHRAECQLGTHCVTSKDSQFQYQHWHPIQENYNFRKIPRLPFGNGDNPIKRRGLSIGRKIYKENFLEKDNPKELEKQLKKVKRDLEDKEAEREKKDKMKKNDEGLPNHEANAVFTETKSQKTNQYIADKPFLQESFLQEAFEKKSVTLKNNTDLNNNETNKNQPLFTETKKKKYPPCTLR
eukprot:TRINITY_DN6535_c0_g1_i1.p1 TRINITY_DN6535_c0_g1~~TRINITY_DN6535_c0_g1_i1.p1  ORF type:complete len:181 (-),score=33.11 TRINITY_DN6535_c0_g1_i1:45-587(-)